MLVPQLPQGGLKAPQMPLLDRVRWLGVEDLKRMACQLMGVQRREVWQLGQPLQRGAENWMELLRLVASESLQKRRRPVCQR